MWGAWTPRWSTLWSTRLTLDFLFGRVEHMKGAIASSNKVFFFTLRWSIAISPQLTVGKAAKLLESVLASSQQTGGRSSRSREFLSPRSLSLLGTELVSSGYRTTRKGISLFNVTGHDSWHKHGRWLESPSILHLGQGSGGHGHPEESHGEDSHFGILDIGQDLPVPSETEVEECIYLVSVLSTQYLLGLAADCPLNWTIEATHAGLSSMGVNL